MWLFGVKDGRISVGSSSNQKTNYKRPADIKKHAEKMGHISGFDKVYSMNDFTQKMSEMEPKEFAAYVQKNGNLVYQKSQTEGRTETSMKITLSERRGKFQPHPLNHPSIGVPLRTNSKGQPIMPRGHEWDRMHSRAPYNNPNYDDGIEWGESDEDELDRLGLHKAKADGWEAIPNDPSDYDWTRDPDYDEDAEHEQEDDGYEYKEFMYDSSSGESGPREPDTITLRRRRRTESKRLSEVTGNMNNLDFDKIRDEIEKAAGRSSLFDDTISRFFHKNQKNIHNFHSRSVEDALHKISEGDVEFGELSDEDAVKLYKQLLRCEEEQPDDFNRLNTKLLGNKKEKTEGKKDASMKLILREDNYKGTRPRDPRFSPEYGVPQKSNEPFDGSNRGPYGYDPRPADPNEILSMLKDALLDYGAAVCDEEGVGQDMIVFEYEGDEFYLRLGKS